MARRRNLALFGAAGRHRHADRPPIAALAGAASLAPTGSKSRRPARWRSSPHFEAPAAWKAAPLFKMCCDSLLASFKIWNAATVGGNICMSLPAGSMISLTASLEGVYTLWPRDGRAPHGCGRRLRHRQPRECPATAASCCARIHLPARALAKRFAFRRASLTHLGRSAHHRHRHAAARRRRSRCSPSRRRRRSPYQLRFDRVPDGRTLREAIFATIPEADYFDDVHGSAALQAPPHLLFRRADPRRTLNGAGA